MLPAREHYEVVVPGCAPPGRRLRSNIAARSSRGAGQITQSELDQGRRRQPAPARASKLGQQKGSKRSNRAYAIVPHPRQAPQAFTGDADNPLSIVIEEVALRVAGNGDGDSA